MLPLCDRILLRLRAKPETARDLARALDADVASVHRVLQALEEGGAVERVPVVRAATLWRLAPGVAVALRPEALVVTGARPPGDVPEPTEERCRAASTRGRPCRLAAAVDGLCWVHGARPGSFEG